MERHGMVADQRPRVVIDPVVAGRQAVYHVMNACLGPRPVAWVSTVDAAGVANLAPHSYTTVFSLAPPVVGFVSVGRKDSLRNVEATGEFVLNIASQDLVERLNLTAADFPPSEDEFAAAGLAHVACDVVRPPRVGEAPVSFETRLAAEGVVPIGDSFLVLGEVVRIHVAADVMSDGRVDPAVLDPVLRLAGSTFGRIGGTFRLRRPTYADVAAGTVDTLTGTVATVATDPE